VADECVRRYVDRLLYSKALQPSRDLLSTSRTAEAPPDSAYGPGQTTLAL